MGLLLIPTFTFAVELKVTDSLTRATSTFPISTSISENGKQVFLVYPIVVDSIHFPPVTLAAEVFTNKCGVLQSTAKLTGDELFPIIDTGFANPTFTSFSVIDDDDFTKIRIRLFDQNFNLQATRTFDDFAAGNPLNPALSGSGGVFSPDGKYIVMTYLIDTTPDNQVSIIRVLNAQDLSDVASTQISGGSAGPNFFSHRKQNYVTLATCGGSFFFGFENPSAAPPSILSVFKLENNNQLTFIDQAFLPQQGGIPSIGKRGGKSLIGIGTQRATLSGEATIFTTNAFNQSFLPNDNNEARIYTFDGRHLKLFIARSTGVTTGSQVFSRNGLLLDGKQVTNGVAGYFNLCTLGRGLRNPTVTINRTFASPPFSYQAFSKDGKWLLVTGSDQLSVDPNNVLHNINLYKVYSPR